MAGVKIVLYRSGLHSLLRSPRGVVGRDALRRGHRVQAVAQRLAPRRSGRLSSSIYVRMRAGILGPIVEVGSPLDYAKWQHDGTGIYGPRHRPIRPKRRGLSRRRGAVLVFDWRGQRVYARSVRGAPPTKFLSRALHAAV